MRNARTGRASCSAFALLFTACASSTLAATFTVTNTGDTGAGSLRQAILDANAGADVIAFDVSGAGCDGADLCTIVPATGLPSLSGTVVVDGYTQPGASRTPTRSETTTRF
jgi:hypothetical protein